MRSKHRCIGIALAIAAAAAISAASVPVAQAANGKPTCKRTGSKTVAQNHFVRVYTFRRSGSRFLYACRRSTGRRVRLYEETMGGLGSVRLKGYYVAYGATFTDASCKADCPPDHQDRIRTIELYNVRTRRARTVQDGAPLGGALVLSSRGGVAWASRSTATGPVEIRASVRAGDNRVIDTGAIDPKSLAIEITIISWKRDGAERFARLH